MTSPYRIVTVCTGNICRSPMAEFMLRQALDAAGLGSRVEVDSAGTTDWERGNPIDPRSARVLRSHGVDDAAGHRARKITEADLAGSELVLALDTDHLDWLLRQASAADRHKIRLLREFDPDAEPAADPAELGIADPWYGTAEDFDQTYRLIAAALPGIVRHVSERMSTQPGTGQHA
ncbi:low molecular weight protein-tyrosine-phosphatase [Psychromicrobium xiongbiense]|uniref:low molecular weight protein-tyrosine-phosphatase n=1 Tax=Psychromicrobium xiongbiense TaxID=3051184 RepID=UPI002552F66D|nr:low molecular weight protein-tyrosine-phosphatase [Psychromicrobium sp. YIM S02556]